jgi:hypothetical protein
MRLRVVFLRVCSGGVEGGQKLFGFGGGPGGCGPGGSSCSGAGTARTIAEAAAVARASVEQMHLFMQRKRFGDGTVEGKLRQLLAGASHPSASRPSSSAHGHDGAPPSAPRALGKGGGGGGDKALQTVSLNQAFQEMDTDGSGSVSSKELLRLLHARVGQALGLTMLSMAPLAQVRDAPTTL